MVRVRGLAVTPRMPHTANCTRELCAAPMCALENSVQRPCAHEKTLCSAHVRTRKLCAAPMCARENSVQRPCAHQKTLFSAHVRTRKLCAAPMCARENCVK